MFSGCLAALTAALGFPPEPYPGDGPCHLRLEDDLDLYVERRGDSLAVRLPLAPSPGPAEARREFLREALKISSGLLAGSRPAVFPWPALGRDGGLDLEARLPGEPRAFVAGVESFLNEAGKWRLALRAARADRGNGFPEPGAFFVRGLRS
jgi:hypothetical protein